MFSRLEMEISDAITEFCQKRKKQERFLIRFFGAIVLNSNKVLTNNKPFFVGTLIFDSQ